jgi:hypothetical protein
LFVKKASRKQVKSLNRLFIIITTSNFILIGCIALLNSILGPWGVFLYLSGLFFLPHYQLLDAYRSLLSLLLTGFLIDHLFNYPLGFHAFLLGLIFHVSREFFHLGKQSPKQIFVYQGFANFILALLWFLFGLFANSDTSSWTIFRFLSDLLFSTVFLIPLSFWYVKFCDTLLHHIEPSLLRISAQSK